MSNLVIIASPSGCGKDTVVRALLQKIPGSRKMITSTTRAPRGAEQDGVHYWFISHDAFLEKIANHEFVEWQDIHGELYGPSHHEIITPSTVTFAVIDVLGALRYQQMDLEIPVKTIFLSPPSKEILIQRLIHRGEENMEQIERRMERYEMEVEMSSLFDYIVVNDDLEHTIDQIMVLLNQESSVS